MTIIKKFFSISATLLLLSCGGTQQNTRTHSPAQPTEQEVTYNLPDGKKLTGYRKQYNRGYYIGPMKNGTPNGHGAFIAEQGTISVGEYINGKRDGLHKIFNTINGLVQFNLIKDGKVIQNYGELDALLATGNFETAAKKRGQKVFLGIQLKDETPYINTNKIIKNSPADLAGIQKNDKLVQLNNIPLVNQSVSFVLRSLISLPYDQPITLKVNRGRLVKQIRFYPGIIPWDHPGATPSAKLLWQNTLTKNTSAAYQHYIDTITDPRYKPKAQSLLKQIAKKEQQAFDAVANQGDNGLIKFCRQYPQSTLLGRALSDHFQKIEKSNRFIVSYSKLIHQCAHAKKHQPSYYELLSAGPDSMTVSDILRLLHNGMSSTLVATKIKTSDRAYQDFSFDEVKQLNQFGLKDDIISAMIEATYSKKKSDDIQSRLKKLEEENSRLKAQRTSQQNQVAAQQKAEEKSMPLECIKLAAAIKACDQSSGFLSMGCKAIAKSQFDCPIPLN